MTEEKNMVLGIVMGVGITAVFASWLLVKGMREWRKLYTTQIEALQKVIQRSGLRLSWCMYCAQPCLQGKRSLCCGDACTERHPETGDAPIDGVEV